MAKYKEGHKQASREEIVRTAADRFRNDGLSAVGVRPIMADAGFTHGAFYAHFSSRSDLVGEAIAFALEGTLARLKTALALPPDKRFEAIVDGYLTLSHRDFPSRGCAATALASELPRESEKVRSQFMKSTRDIVELLAGTLPEGGSDASRMKRAFAIFAAMIGTMQMMRIATSAKEIGLLRSAGREAALALASQPWP